MGDKPKFESLYQQVLVEVDPEFQRCVDEWVRYLDKAEEIDRCYPHRPSKYGRGVISMFGRPLRDRHNEELRAARTRLHGRMIPREAREVADRIHEFRLKPCECDSCTMYRGGR